MTIRAASTMAVAAACLLLMTMWAASMGVEAAASAAIASASPSSPPPPPSPYPNPHLTSTADGLLRWRTDLPSSVRTVAGGADRTRGREGALGASANYSDWMGELMEHVGNLTLKQLILPGTHDSGAFELSRNLAPDAGGAPWIAAAIALAESLGIPLWDVITPWALAQSLTLGEQAQQGVRYFDLRVCYNGTTFLTHHFETGRPISELLADLAQFVRAHPAEIIVVEAQLHRSSMIIPLEAKRALAAEMQRHFAGLLYVETDRFNQTIRELVQRNQRVLLSIDDEDMYDASVGGGGGGSAHALWWGPRVIWNTYANSADLATMQLYDTGQVKAFNAKSSSSGGSSLARLRKATADPVDPAAACGRYGAPNGAAGACAWKISWTLTPDAGAILRSLTPGLPTSLLSLAATANAVLDAFVGAQWMGGPPPLRMGNILIVDDVENTPLMDIVLKQNLQAAMEQQGRTQATVPVTRPRVQLHEQRSDDRTWPVPASLAEE